MTEITPIINTAFISEDKVRIIADLDELIPKRKGNEDTQEAKNGEVDIEYFKQSFNMKAWVKEDKNTTMKYKLNIRRLPSRIKSLTWKLEPGVVIMILTKEKQVAEDGSEFYLDWGPIVRARLLDQYRSDEDEDGNTPDSAHFNLQSDKFEELGLNVEMGKDNQYEIDAEDMDKLDL